MYGDLYGPGSATGAVTPRSGPQDTDKAAQESLAQSGPGALNPPPAIPRAIPDVLDELNDVRQQVSVLWAEEWKANKWGSVRPTPPTREPYNAEKVGRDKKMADLENREQELLHEIREVLAASRINPPGRPAPTQVEAQKNAAPRQE